MPSALATAALTVLLQGDASGLPPGEPIRGITVSTHRSGREWADPRVMEPTFEKIADLGANWVAIHPYAWIRADGTVVWRRRSPGRDADDPPPHWTRPIELAHAAGLKILVKPHLGYWGSPFRWRGEIDFEGEALARFFQTYERWILALAEACKHADGFVVGTELDRTVRHEKAWRRIVAGVRRRTKAALTYAANWTDYERVPFWDALDVIGVQAYFPLTERADPTAEQLAAAWRGHMRRLRAFARRHRRNVVFTELGYDESLSAAREPWAPRRDGPRAPALKLRCLDAALEAIHAEPAVLGAFLWKWFPEPRPNGRDFRLATPDVRTLIARHWKTPKRSAADKE